MTTNRFLQLLGGDRVAVCDGAMGTMLYARGVFVNRSFDELNLSNPDLVRGVHELYVAAGADILETNTFSANRFKLAAHGCEGLVRQINLQGARVAREAAGANRVLVAGAMGPLGVRIEPWGPTSTAEAREAFREQAAALLEGEVDLFVLETFYHLPELHEAVRAVRGISDKPIVAQLTVTDETCTPEGVRAADFARQLASWDVDCIGVNCGVGPVATLEALEEMRQATDLPLAAQPNAGQPRNIHGRNIYLTSPDYMASYARRFIQAGARLVGGCCGTMPEHIRAIKEAVVAVRPEAPRVAVSRGSEAGASERQVARSERSAMARALAERRQVLAVQVIAPRGCDPRGTVEAVQALREGGVELVSIPEGPGSGRLPPFALAQILARDCGVEPVVEYTCRQRTLLRMQSDFLGAHALGLRNVVLVTGAPQALGEYPDATAQLEVDSIGLTNMVRRLNLGLDVAGNPLGGQTAFHFGVHLDAAAVDPAYEIRRFEWKVDAGAEFALTRPILDVAAFQAFLPKIAHCRIPLVAAVPLLSSYRDAERLRRSIGALTVPEDLLRRLREAEKDGQAAEEGLRIALEIARALRPLVEGLQLVTSELRPEPVRRFLEGVRG